MAGNIFFLLKIMWESKLDTVCLFLRAPLMVAASFLGIYLSKEVVGAVTQRRTPAEVIAAVGWVSLMLIVCLTAQKALTARLNSFMMNCDMSLQMILIRKLIGGDYENIESADGRTRVDKAMENVGSDNRGGRLIAYELSSLTSNIIGVVSYAAMLLTLGPWILLAVAVTTLGSFAVMKSSASWNHRHKDVWKPFDRRLGYLGSSAGDFTKAKDIRLYDMSDWFRGVFDEVLAGRMRWHAREQRYYFRGDALRALLSLVRDAVSYGLLVWLLFARHMTVADFVLYFGLIGGFAAWLNGLAEDFNNLSRFHLGFCEMREFLDYPDRANHGKGLPLPKANFPVEFRHVSYRYAGAASDTVKDLSFTIKSGEKLAVVGPNGAGKTTLVKLLCGLYTPTQGEILIGGRPINAYNREEYYSLYAVVFQDIFLLPLSVACNVASAAEPGVDREKVREALRLAGLAEKIGSLPQGIDTKLVKSVYDDAVDLSGGEIQKLALARALYKGGQALILDEPTAALDPIAESRIYHQYSRMTGGHTSVFISHRLASTRFCDRIFYLENGVIAECGTHETLLEKRGKYAEMFEVQSHYYREEAKDDEARG